MLLRQQPASQPASISAQAEPAAIHTMTSCATLTCQATQVASPVPRLIIISERVFAVILIILPTVALAIAAVAATTTAATRPAT
jgi:hypothetical protein